MKEVKDPEIKLFGRNISSPESGAIPAVYGHNCGVVAATEESCSSDGDRSRLSLDDSSDGNREGELMETEQLQLQIQRRQSQEVEKEHHLTAGSVENELQETVQPAVMEEPMNSKFIPDSDVKSRTPSAIDEDTAAAKQPKNDCDQSKTANSQQQTLKKPDKILPCPRCNSMDTKFCYYNNYNINQPRHFCKSCQRYWTDGGTMRSVPVGAGRRKNKNSALHFRHITIPEALLAARPDVSNGLCHPAVSPNGRVLSFGSDTPLCESMSSVLNLTDHKAPNGVTISCKGAKNGNDCCHGSSAIASNSMGEGGRKCHQEPPLQNINGSQIAWSCPWNSVVPLPAVFTSGFPMPIFLPPFWNCGVPAPCVPWLSPPSPSTNQKSTGSGPSSPTLGKHSRDEDFLIASSTEENEQVEKNNSEVSILVPKTLRSDDPDEAARSSIWTTLGIKNDFVTRNGLFKGFQPKDNKESHMVTPSPVLQANPGIKNDFPTRNGLFKGFQPKDNKKSHIVTPSPVLQANPASLSRFLNFQENA